MPIPRPSRPLRSRRDPTALPSRPRLPRSAGSPPASRSPLLRNRRFPAPCAALILAVALAGCLDAGGSVEAVREALPGGGERVRYGPLPAEVPRALEPDLRIGVVEGESRYMFGQVRGIEADDEGRIYVLDNQAGETRVFAPDGTFLRAIAGRGEGPGEVLDPNGIVRAPDGTFWIQDPRRWLLVRVTPEGDEVERMPMFVRQWGFVWNATMDREGRIWTPVNHQVGEFRPPDPGLSESASRTYLRFHDLRSGEGDSVFVAERVARGWAIALEAGWGFRSMPWEPSLHTAVDPSGTVWVAHGERYRVTRVDARGDTLLVVEADVPPEPVTAEEREEFLAAARERDADEERIARQILQAAREVKPVIVGLAADEEGNVWVRRQGREGEPPRFDVFSAAGEYVGSVRVPARLPPYFPLRFRGGHLYALTTDEMDVQSVVRIPLPLPEG